MTQMGIPILKAIVKGAASNIDAIKGILIRLKPRPRSEATQLAIIIMSKICFLSIWIKNFNVKKI